MDDFNVLDCATRLKQWIIHTPLVEVDYLSENLGCKVYVKLENMQRTGAFKFRGAMNFMLTANPADSARGAITASSGNHGLGLALSGKLLGYHSTVILPRTAARIKEERAIYYGAKVLRYGSDYEAAQEYARTLAADQSLLYVSSFDHPAVIEGQGTILPEILHDLPDTAIVLAPIGGGGLVSGLLRAKAQLGSTVSIVGVQASGAAAMHKSLATGRLLTLDCAKTVATGVSARTPGALTFAILQSAKTQVVLVEDDAIIAAQRELCQHAKVIAEPAGAVAVAALRAARLPKTKGPIVCIVSGGNVDFSASENLFCS